MLKVPITALATIYNSCINTQLQFQPRFLCPRHVVFLLQPGVKRSELTTHLHLVPIRLHDVVVN